MAVRKTVFGLVALAAGAALLSAPSAAAAPDPCAASTIARTVGSVGTNTGIYLEAHPDTNDVLTTLAARPAGPQSVAALKLYFDRDPQAAEDLQAIQQPLTALTAKCKLPISLPQVLGLIQSAQQGGQPAGLPDAAAEAAVVDAPEAPVSAGTTPAPVAPRPAVPAGIGAHPGLTTR